jgi:chemotaxis protein methyltransferase CheR
MTTPAPGIDPAEFQLMRRYIESHCGLHLSDEKTYLVDTRLTPLMAELGCRSFYELHAKASADTSHALRDRIIDALTTHETLWFRDSSPFAFLEAEVLPKLAARARAGAREATRIWCAACSTGQEAYSTAMTVLECARSAVGPPARLVEIVATDVSPSVLFLARAGRYDGFAMGRGLPDHMRERYFTRSGELWAVGEEVKRMVRFEKHNLQDSFGRLGVFDVVLCRNVLMYFADELKRDILQRMRAALRPGGYLLLGSAESPAGYCDRFELVKHGRGVFYRLA